VRETGGLYDSIKPYYEDENGAHGNGFTFANYDASELEERTSAALSLYEKYPDEFAALRDRALTSDFSWDASAAKYMDMACDAVAQAVTHTAQTFVDALKSDGAFTKEKQEEAFEKAKSKALKILGDTVVAALNEIYGDFDLWLDTKIEQVCREIKVPPVDTTAAATAASVATSIAATAVQQLTDCKT